MFIFNDDNMLLILLVSNERTEYDFVKNISDYPYNGRMFSGYLDVSNSQKKLHYLFVESEMNPKKDQIIIWLNGGPGCSSLFGWAQEHGPAILEENDNKFNINPHSWHKIANIMYLESPADLGFSYIKSNKPEDFLTNDKISGDENLEAIVSFFQKFPSLKKKRFVHCWRVVCRNLCSCFGHKNP